MYNASAGSGKTFTLVKEYLKILLQSENIFHFQKILAITFTNKAAAEMKERVLENLEAFSKGETTIILSDILNETTLDRETIRLRSEKIFNVILQNYSAFSITTIDSFTYKIIRSFAFDLGLSINFEVEMDAVSLLNEAVDVLISKIGSDKKITKLLIDFSLDKIDDDKSWDISRELNEFAKILLNEDDVKQFRKLSSKSVDDFLVLNKKLKLENKKIENSFKELGEKGLALIKNNAIQHNDFSYGDLPKHFIKLTNYKFTKATDINFSGRLATVIDDDRDLYTNKTLGSTKDIIDGIREELIGFYYKSKELFEKKNGVYRLHKLILKNSIPLAVLNHVNQELTVIKEENNIRLNAEFNQLISDEIKEQPAPFIYERIGQKYMHYFIDEMQDTSQLQWQNLIPLIDNALAQEDSSLLLVGDGKQAIYRWRGGKAAQFINLGALGENAENPFHINKKIKELATNYRSFSQIIDFNNQFFQQVSKFFQKESYEKLFFEGNHQLENANKGGFVSLSFLEKTNDKEEKKIRYPEKVLEIINNLDPHFSLNDVCVLVRKKKDGVAIANYLSENGIDIVSSETLLLSNSLKVNFITHLLQVIEHPSDQETRLEMLYFLYEHLQIKTAKHSFLADLIHLESQLLFTALKLYGINFDLDHFYQLPFYEKVEEIIRSFTLIETSDAYVQFFLDVVLDRQRKGTTLQEFLDFWELKKDKLSIVAPESDSAVQVMTIHKSKGLEFPIVIFPGDLDIYQQVNPKVWLDGLSKEAFNNFDELLISYTKDLEIISKRGLAIYNRVREELELDNLNLLYVALTRAVEQIYIITENKLMGKNKEEDVKYFSGMFIRFLKERNHWKDDVLEYSFGDPKRISAVKKGGKSTEIQEKFISTTWQEHNVFMLASSSKLWDTTQGDAIDFGNLIHEMMSKITTEKEVIKVVNQYIQEGVLNSDGASEIENTIYRMVRHPKLRSYFSEDMIVFNEREIVAVDHQIIIPDRLVFNRQNEAIIIDYKTGKPSKNHHQQLLKYEGVLNSIHIKVIKKLLVYINEEILVEEV